MAISGQSTGAGVTRPEGPSAPASTRYLLYYAGSNKLTEQIGLAVSADGVHFERAGQDGLVLPVDPSVPWRSRRTSNPAVLPHDGGFVMFFQGASAGFEHVSLGVARSTDGVTWRCAPEPCLAWQEMGRVDPRQDPSSRVGVIEPSVLYDEGRFRMWFVYWHEPTHPSNALFYAESATGERWDVDPTTVLSGDTFGFCWLHYPQVLPLRHGGYELLFTLRSRRTLVDAVYRATSRDGVSWSATEPVLRLPFRVVRSGRSIAGRALGRVTTPAWTLAGRVFPCGRNLYGYSHAHLLPSEQPPVLYYHNDGLGPRGRVHDISRRVLRGRRWVDPVRVLEPAGPDAWDNVFVADPYVVVRG